jgi:hypothetical protein
MKDSHALTDTKEVGSGGLNAVDAKQDGLADLKDLHAFVDAQQGKEKKVITDGTFSLLGKLLFLEDAKNRRGSRRLCIPSTLEKDIIAENHDHVGHPGIRRTYSSVSSRFYFPRLSKKIRQHVHKCSICQSSKPSYEKQTGLLYAIPPGDP